MKQYCKDIKTEFGKISWLGKKELIKKTAATIVMAVALAVFILAADTAFKAGIGSVISMFS